MTNYRTPRTTYRSRVTPTVPPTATVPTVTTEHRSPTVDRDATSASSARNHHACRTVLLDGLLAPLVVLAAVPRTGDGRPGRRRAPRAVAALRRTHRVVNLVYPAVVALDLLVLASRRYRAARATRRTGDRPS